MGYGFFFLDTDEHFSLENPNCPIQLFFFFFFLDRGNRPRGRLFCTRFCLRFSSTVFVHRVRAPFPLAVCAGRRLWRVVSSQTTRYNTSPWRRCVVQCDDGCVRISGENHYFVRSCDEDVVVDLTFVYILESRDKFAEFTIADCGMIELLRCIVDNSCYAIIDL